MQNRLILTNLSTLRQDEPQPGDYYGVVYKGSFLAPLIGIVLVVAAIIVIRKRRR
jgi:LPXTG-motif cell wall-anchored protein